MVSTHLQAINIIIIIKLAKDHAQERSLLLLAS